LRFVSCLLLDLAMPGMNGFEVKRELAARGLRIPTVFVTAHTGDVEQDLVTADAIAILRKPVDQQMLLRLVRSAAGERRRTLTPRAITGASTLRTWARSGARAVNSALKCAR